MDSIGQELGSTLDLKHLFEMITPVESKTNIGKSDPLNTNDLPADFGLAYLGPQLWSDTVMSDDLKLEPINLDDLLVENTLPSELTEIPSLLSLEHTQSSLQKDIAGNGKEPDKVPNGNQNFAMLDNVFPPAPVTFHQTYNTAETLSIPTILPLPVQNPMLSPPDLQQKTTTPAKDQQKNFEYEPDITDVMISTPLDEAEGTPSLFDPRKRAFSEEELKPQPIIRKAKKVYVPDESKDAKYWQKREKNNVAAKRSRAARRIKENQIAMRTTFLEKENDNLRNELKEVRSELQKLMEVVKGYKEKQTTN